MKDKKIIELFKERNDYKNKYENALKVINAEIERIKKVRANYIKNKKMNNFELMTSDYHLRFLNEIKEQLK
jgi:hypothetical protein